MKPLVVLPYPGEFGWELMNWQARVRRVVNERRHQRIVLCTPPDKRPLYECPNAPHCTILPVEPPALPGHASEDHRIDAENRPIEKAAVSDALRRAVEPALTAAGHVVGAVEYLLPPMNGTMWPTRRPFQHFLDLRLPASIHADVLLVPRNRSTAAERNRPRGWWDDLAGGLDKRGLRVATYEPRVETAIRQLSSCRLAIGASTGGLHLAALCRCPHYLWGCGPEVRWTRLRITNRQRYETAWNPFGTPCRYDECGWSPGLEYVVGQSLRAFESIGLDPSRGAPATPLNTRWRIKRRLIDVLHEPARWPWRVQSFVREKLV